MKKPSSPLAFALLPREEVTSAASHVTSWGCVEFLVHGGFLNKQQRSQQTARNRMAEQEKKTKVNIAFVFLLPVSVQRCLTSSPCAPHFSWILPGYSHNRDTHFFVSSSRLLQATGGCSPPTWSFLGSFLSDRRLGSLPLLCSCLPRFLPLDLSDGAAWSHLGWKPKWAREQEPAFLWSLPSFVTALRGRFSATATQLSPT